MHINPLVNAVFAVFLSTRLFMMFPFVDVVAAFDLAGARI